MCNVRYFIIKNKNIKKRKVFYVLLTKYLDFGIINKIVYDL